MSDDSFQTMRRTMVASQLRANAVSDPAVLAAMAAVPREAFVPSPRRALAYVDIVLPVGNGRMLNPPMVTGRLLSEAAPRLGEHALVVGAAFGYSAALLVEIGLTVMALEDADFPAEPPVAAGGERVVGPLREGWAAAAPYDLILVDGAVETIPEGLVDQLRDGGRLAAALLERGVARLVVGRRSGAGFGVVTYADAEAAPLPGFAMEQAFSF